MSRPHRVDDTYDGEPPPRRGRVVVIAIVGVLAMFGIVVGATWLADALNPF